MSLEHALELISQTYNISKPALLELLEKKKESIEYNIILPYSGKIYNDRCKGIIFNHGLYTQCCEKINIGFCKNCEKQKYGSIFDREKYELGKYVSKTGKPELQYSKFIKKMNYNIEDVKKCFIANNIDFMDYFEDCKTKTRGRPRKETSVEVRKNTDEDTLEVVRVTVSGKDYYKSKEGVLLDIESYDICGILKDNNIEDII